MMWDVAAGIIIAAFNIGLFAFGILLISENKKDSGAHIGGQWLIIFSIILAIWIVYGHSHTSELTRLYNNYTK